MKSIFTLLLFFGLFQTTYAQCPGCTINLPPDLQEDTIFMTDAPDGTAFDYYEEDISFRMPLTTTPVSSIDSTTPPGLPISQMTITNVSNVPPGLSWEASQLVYNTGEMETDGCVRFCGTPLVSDSFFVQVEVEAVVFGFPNPATFALPIYIAPQGVANDGFSMTGNIGCGSATVSFQNENPSNGLDGFDYFWDFGNGNTSIDENPSPQTYDQVGTYTVQYSATIDTAGYTLTQVVIFGTDCSDFNIPPADKPDLFVKVFDPQGNEIYTSEVQNNVSTPAYFSLYLPLNTGNYTIEVWDDELIGNEFCGSVNINQTTTGTLYDGALTVEVSIYHPITTVTASGEVIVYEQPEPPVLSWNAPTNFCEGDSLLITADYQEGLQWFRDSMALTGDTLPQLTIYESGSYWVSYTSPDGCISNSDEVNVEVLPLPDEPVFTNTDNWLSLAANAPADAMFQWFYNDQALPDETGDSLCITQSGTYGLLVTDPATGCSNFFSSEEIFNPDTPCNVAATEVEELYGFWLSPNPFAERLRIHWYSGEAEGWSWDLHDLHGRRLLKGEWFTAGGNHEESLDLSYLPKGVYLLRIKTKNGLISQRVVKAE